MDKDRRLAGLPRNIWVVTATSFLTDISSEMLFNLIPLFLANVLGVGTAIIGLIDGVAETTASVMKYFSGALSDRLGQRKWLAVAGYALSTIAKPFLYFADAWGWVLGVRFSDRMGKGVRTAPRDALVADSIDEKRRGLAFGVHRAGDTAGAFVGLGLAALIVWLTESGAAELTRRTFQIAVLVSIVPAVLGVLVLALGATDMRRGARQPSAMRLTLAGIDTRFRLFRFIRGVAGSESRVERSADHVDGDDLQPGLCSAGRTLGVAVG
jgi:MFS family permease